MLIRIPVWAIGELWNRVTKGTPMSSKAVIELWAYGLGYTAVAVFIAVIYLVL